MYLACFACDAESLRRCARNQQHKNCNSQEVSWSSVTLFRIQECRQRHSEPIDGPGLELSLATSTQAPVKDHSLSHDQRKTQETVEFKEGKQLSFIQLSINLVSRPDTTQHKPTSLHTWPGKQWLQVEKYVHHFRLAFKLYCNLQSNANNRLYFCRKQKTERSSLKLIQ